MIASFVFVAVAEGDDGEVKWRVCSRQSRAGNVSGLSGEGTSRLLAMMIDGSRRSNDEAAEASGA